MKIVYKGGFAEITEKKSRFIANVAPVHSEKEATDFIMQIKKKYWDCKHNCSAFVIAATENTPEISRCNDDGEPAGTAGRPILDLINNEQVKNVCIVVSRYFGGTLLGTGGLVRAYGQAAKKGLLASEVLTKMTGKKIIINMSYDYVGKVQYIAKEFNLHEIDSSFESDVTLTYLVPDEREEEIINKIIEVTFGRANLTISDPISYAINENQFILFDDIL